MDTITGDFLDFSFWTVGGSWITQKEPMQAQGEHANFTQVLGRCLDLRPGPSCPEEKVQDTTMLLRAG